MTTTHSLRAIIFSIGLSLVLSALTLPAQAQDTAGNRLAAAYRYVKVADVSKFLNNMIQQIALNYPEDKRQHFIQFMSTMDFSHLETVMVSALAQHFTVDELELLADFYGSPIGKSVMKKMPQYMATVMPSIEAILIEQASKFRK